MTPGQKKPLIASPEVAALKKIEAEASNPAFEQDAEYMAQWVRRLQLQRFHGKLVINFQNGIVAHLNEERSHIPPHRQK